MRVLLLGGAGFLGKRLALQLLEQNVLDLGGQQERELSELIVFDHHMAEGLPEDSRLRIVQGDICDPHSWSGFIDQKGGVIFHLAAIVSGEAEQNFELGMDVNLHATLKLLEYCRSSGTCPVFVFASSCGVYGGALTNIIRDDTAATPQSSYGTQKALADLLINDYSRRGWIDGRSLRLPTIVVRPGKPNAATSSFASSIIREPLQGRSVECPVSDETKIWILSPKRVTDCFIHAAQLPQSELGPNRVIVLPGLTTTVREIIDSLIERRGEEIGDLIKMKPDAFIRSIVLTWPPNFEPKRAGELGFIADQSIGEVIDQFIADELN